MTGIIFIIGFMLAGVFTDYKEAERLPSDIANSVISIHNHSLTVKSISAQYNPSSLDCYFIDLLGKIENWLKSKDNWDTLFNKIELLSSHFSELKKNGGDLQFLECERKNIFCSLTRIKVMKETVFLRAGYTIMWFMSIVVVIIISLVKHEDPLFGYFCQGFYTLLVFSTLNLIKDMDDPFEFGKRSGGSAEVDIEILSETRKILSNNDNAS
jgi:hypothetical protein